MDLTQYTYAALRKGYAQKDFLPSCVLKAYIARIKNYEHLNVYITSTMEAALEGAKAADLRVQKGDMPFERVIATPDMMGTVGKLGQILGPKGLMPNPKLGTVTMDVTSAVKAAKGGSVEFRAQKEGIVHVGVGKASFDEKKLCENIRALLDAVVKAKPATMKGNYLRKASLSSTMGPGVKLELASLLRAAA